MNTPRDAPTSAPDDDRGLVDAGWPVTARRNGAAGNGHDRDIHLGAAHPIGAHWDGQGTNFSLYSEVADGVELCLFDDTGREQRIELPERHAHIHHVYLPGVGPGQRYGYRVHGPWDPGLGLRCNAAKLLIDPYARAVEGSVDWKGPVFGHRRDEPGRPDRRDSAPHVPRSLVIDPAFDWRGDEPLRTPWHHTIIYEAHVRGLSMTHPGVPPALRGTYAGMASEPILRHLVELGITAVELMPVHHFIPEGFTVDRGLTNYWGYSTAAFFAPHGSYSSAGDGGAQVTEFKELVRALHAVGIEVILDVVYNHTTEGTADGPTLSMRGIDNGTYYRLSEGDPGRYQDFTGTGNTLNVRHPATLALVMDSLRYWVLDMHIDGFRFDLASALARELYEVDRLSSFFDMIHQDPVINRVKLIAEPWDVGPGGYQVGNFPPQWSEWNARYRDGVRDFWRGDDESIADLAFRFTGSSDLYDNESRRPSASINFVTAHDGFTLRDLVSYNRKHNLANGESGRDGHDDNRSWNSGVEGPTANPDVVEIRRRRGYSLLATLLLSQGVPMISGGDEIGRTQLGNNNAYCQDNEISWHDWSSVDTELLAFCRRLIRIRRLHPTFRRRRFFNGRPVLGSNLEDIGWFRPDGTPMTDADWRVGYARALSVFLNGGSIVSQGPRVEPVIDRSYLVLFNASPEPLGFTVPAGLGGERWRVVIDTADPANRDETVTTSDDWELGAWSLVLLERNRVQEVTTSGDIMPLPGEDRDPDANPSEMAAARPASAGRAAASPAARTDSVPRHDTDRPNEPTP